MILHDSMDNYYDHPINRLARARLRTKQDWLADAILIEAQLAIKNLHSARRVGDFARSTLYRMKTNASHNWR